MLLAVLPAEDLSVLTPGPDCTTPDQFLEHWLASRVEEAIARRRDEFEKTIKSAAACQKWQEERRAFFRVRIGGLPERTPLNAQITGTLKGEGYRIEKILLETRPGFHLTAYLLGESYVGMRVTDVGHWAEGMASGAIGPKPSSIALVVIG